MFWLCLIGGMAFAVGLSIVGSIQGDGMVIGGLVIFLYVWIVFSMFAGIGAGLIWEWLKGIPESIRWWNKMRKGDYKTVYCVKSPNEEQIERAIELLSEMYGGECARLASYEGMTVIVWAYPHEPIPDNFVGVLTGFNTLYGTVEKLIKLGYVV